LVTYPNKHDQVFFAQIEQARDRGTVAVGATIYLGSPESSRQTVGVSQVCKAAHQMGKVTILWCCLPNAAFEVGGPSGETWSRRCCY
jgi:class I fructose-bisphosphate aldolase